MKKLSNFVNYAISSKESLNIKGGMMCQASCNGIAGAWTGNYSSFDSVANSINRNCGGYGGSYQCQIL